MRFQAGNVQAVSGWVGRLLRFDLSVFDEIRSDTAATTPAIIVVTVASFMSGLGSWLWWTVRDFRGFDAGGDVFVRSFVFGSILQVAVWFLWLYVAYQVLARVYGTHADFYEMLRAMGFAFAPMGLALLMVITPLGIPLAIFATMTTVLLTNIAIQSTTTADGQQVLTANIAGFAVFAIVMGILANISQVQPFGGLAPGIFFFNLA